ncbi:MAG: DNA replication/repair protein RecF [Rickettsiales bacterium]
MKDLHNLEENTVKVYIDTVNLTNFRNFTQKELSLSPGLTAIIGHNGVGKTNLLEAISLAAPGRGLRGSKIEELENINSSTYLKGFNISLNFIYKAVNYNFSTAKLANSNKRIFTLNNNKLKKQTDIANYLNLLWLTPLYDSIFSASKTERRKFFDRIIFNLHPEHISNLQKYDYYQRERINIMLNYGIKANWLDTIELKLAELNSAIAATRVEIIKYLNNELEALDAKYPKALLYFTDGFEKMYLDKIAPSEIEQEAQNLLYKNRNSDLHKKQTMVGIHKTDFSCFYLKKNINSIYCSTGEQKSLLASIFIALARLLSKINGKTPILLLDEILSHLDKKNSLAFIEDLKILNIQAIMTGTDKKFFNSIQDINIIELT